MRLFTIAGEPSGDARCAELVSALGARSDISAAGMGGPLCARAGVEILERMEDYAVMGFGEVLRSLGSFAGLEERLKRACAGFHPDAVVLVDYPGFNMRFASWARRAGLKVVYFVSPQYWAWGGWRVRRARRSVDLMIVLFRFELDYYSIRGVRCFWSGHPLVDSIPSAVPGGLRLALLPGSRSHEVRRLLPVMLEAAGALVDGGLVEGASIAVAPSVPDHLYEGAAERPWADLRMGILDALADARAALVCSGTATLETALAGVPFAVLYRTSPLTYRVARLLVTGVDRICLASIVAGTRVAPELIQDRATAGEAVGALLPLLTDGAPRDEGLSRLALVREALGPPGAAGRAADAVIEFLGA